MTVPISIRFPPAKAVSPQHNLAVLRAASERNPDQPLIRMHLAKLLNHQDAFDECIALLSAAKFDDLGFEELLALAAAHYARRGPDDLKAALAATMQAIANAQDDYERSMALCEHAKGLERAGNALEAVELLNEALTLNPHNIEAFKRLVQSHLENRDSAAVVTLTDMLQARGVKHSRLLGMRTLALAGAGRIEEARATSGIGSFVRAEPLDVPEGWDSLEDFNAALYREIMDNPGLRYERFGTASVDSWRVDAPTTKATPAAQALVAAIGREVEAYVQAMPESDHPWITTRPKDAFFDIWSIITDHDGHEQWHMHPNGWMTGGYYPTVPEPVVTGDDKAGCLVFGLPDGLIGADAAQAYGEQWIRPKPGLLTLFPSHFYHRTYPHNSNGKRICVAFDIQHAG